MAEWELGDGQQTEVPAKKSRKGLIAVITVVVLACAGFFVWRQFFQPRGPVETPADAGVDAGVDAGAEPSLSLSEGDALLRKVGAAWSTSKEFARWLGVEDIIHRLTAAVNLVADGESPSPVLQFIKIKGEFTAQEESTGKGKKGKKKMVTHKHKPPLHPGPMSIAPESYARYDTFTEVFASVDAAAVGKAYAQLKPYFDSAYAQLGKPNTKFDDRLVAALRRLTSVKLLEGKVDIVPKGAVYAFKDPAVEGLSAAEKHLLRMGPKNGKAIQESLHKFADAAGFDLTPKP